MSQENDNGSNNKGGSREKSFGKKASEAAALGAVGAVAGALALGALGAFIGGPPGAVLGAKIGGLLGGGGAGSGGSIT